MKNYTLINADLSQIGIAQKPLAEAQNSFAWFLATETDAKLRDPAQALAHSKKAVGLAPKNSAFWNTLGVAHYRNYEWRDSITALEKSEELLRREGRPENWLFLAMAHWQLEQKDEARALHDKAVEWMKNNPANDEVTRFRAEADELLGIVNKPEEAKEDLKSLSVDKDN